MSIILWVIIQVDCRAFSSETEDVLDAIRMWRTGKCRRVGPPSNLRRPQTKLLLTATQKYFGQFSFSKLTNTHALELVGGTALGAVAIHGRRTGFVALVPRVGVVAISQSRLGWQGRGNEPPTLVSRCQLSTQSLLRFLSNKFLKGSRTYFCTGKSKPQRDRGTRQFPRR